MADLAENARLKVRGKKPVVISSLAQDAVPESTLCWNRVWHQRRRAGWARYRFGPQVLVVLRLRSGRRLRGSEVQTDVHCRDERRGSASLAYQHLGASPTIPWRNSSEKVDRAA